MGSGGNHGKCYIKSLRRFVEMVKSHNYFEVIEYKSKGGS